MKNFLLGITGLIALVAAPAMAADLQAKYRPAPVAPPFSWNGCYVGLHGGGGWLNSDYIGSESFGGGGGGVAGGQLGCNYQAAGSSWVFGIEAEGWWSGMEQSREFITTLINFPPFTSQNFIATVENKWDIALSARVGLAAFDRGLVYGKAGVAWGKFEYFRNNFIVGGPPNFDTESGSDNLIGVLLGVGLEYAFTPNWTGKIEYNYINYPSQNANFACTNSQVNFVFCSSTQSVSAAKNIVKAGFNYKF